MILRILGCLVLGWFGNSVHAGDLLVEENPTPANSFVVVKYKLDKGDSVLFDVYPEPVKMREHTDTEYAYLFFNGTQQKYQVNASIVNFDTKKFTKKRETVVIGGTGPLPPIPVPPLPPGPVPPTPEPSVLYDPPIRLFIVEETSARTTAIAKMILDVDYWNGLEKTGYVMRPYDVSGVDAKRLGLDKIKQPLPFIVISDKSGNVIRSDPLPLTRDGVTKILPPIKTKLNLDTPVVVPLTTYTLPSSSVYEECPGGVCPPTYRPSTRRVLFR